MNSATFGFSRLVSAPSAKTRLFLTGGSSFKADRHWRWPGSPFQAR
jgi:hypothetical protein